MKVLELLEEIEEIAETSQGFPLTGKIMVDKDELLDIVKDIRVALPDEIQQAQWIKEERQRILDDAKTEYEQIVSEAREKAAELVDKHDITAQARAQAAETLEQTTASCRQMKLSTCEYVDSILFNMQEKMKLLNATYFQEMFDKLESTFMDIDATLSENREEISNMAFRVQNEE